MFVSEQISFGSSADFDIGEMIQITPSGNLIATLFDAT